MNYKKEYIYPSINVTKNKELFEDMARNGWLLTSVGSDRASFVESEPKEMKFFIIPKKSLKKKREEEIRETLRNSGWKKIVENFSYYVYIIDASEQGSYLKLTEEDEREIFRKSNIINLQAMGLGSFTLLFPYIFNIIMTPNYNFIYHFFYEINTNFNISIFKIMMVLILIVTFIKELMNLFSIESKYENRDLAKKFNITNTIKSYSIILLPLVVILVSYNYMNGKVMPDVANGPYFTLADMGIDYKNFPKDKEKSTYIPYSSHFVKEITPFSTSIDSYERYGASPFGKYYNISTRIYSMKNEKYRNLMLETLIYYNKRLKPIEGDKKIDGFDLMYTDGYCLLFTKGNTIWQITYTNSDLNINNNDSLAYYAFKENLVDYNKVLNR